MSDTVFLLVVALPLIIVWCMALLEVALRSDLGWLKRATWVAFLVLVPVVSLAWYVVVRPPRRRLLSNGGLQGATAAEILVSAAEDRQRGDLTEHDYLVRIAELGRRDPIR